MTRLALAALVLGLPLAGFAGEPSGGADLSREIERIADGKRAPESLALRLDWMREGHMMSAEILGSGVGIWNGRTQVRVAPDDVLALARALRSAGFGGMPGAFGEEDIEAPKIQGKLSVRVDGRRKTVVQLLEGPKSRELEELATRVFGLVEAGVKIGVSAVSLSDGLAKLAAGTLAPETFEMVVQRRPETSQPKDVEEEGFLLRVNGLAAVARPFRQKGGYGPPKRLVLSPAELATLIELLKGGAPDALPSGLWASQYTELRLSILGQAADITARRALGATAETHGEKQKAFDRIFAAARALAERVLRSGT